MPTKLYIYGDLGLWPGCNSPTKPPEEFIEDLRQFLKNSGIVIWDGDEHCGLDWNIDLLMYDDADIEGCVQKLVGFFRQWGIPDGRLSFTAFPENAGLNAKCQRFEFPEIYTDEYLRQYSQ